MQSCVKIKLTNHYNNAGRLSKLSTLLEGGRRYTHSSLVHVKGELRT